MMTELLVEGAPSRLFLLEFRLKNEIEKYANNLKCVLILTLATQYCRDEL